jgi:preprotein translocase subunit SecF
MSNNEKNTGYTGEQVEFSQTELGEHQERLAADKSHEAAEQLKENKESLESSARHEIERLTVEKEAPHHEKTAERSPAERPHNTKAARKKAYQSIMKQTQAELPLASRAFSKVIHNPAIEKTSEVVGSTIARPNAILSGALFAFLITLLIYVVARANGYPLSGSETIAGFIVGWVIGMLYDFFRVMITGKK